MSEDPISNVVAGPVYDRMSIRQISRALNMSWETIDAAIRQSSLAPSGFSRGSPVFRLSEVVQVIFTESTDAAPVDPEKMTPRDRKDFFHSKNLERQYLERRGELITIDAYEAGMSLLIQLMAQFLTALPNQMERKAKLTPGHVDVLEKCIDQQRDVLAHAVSQQAKRLAISDE